ncbi:flagellar protein FlaG [Thermodesulfovibrio sp.]|uniref:flagellar protein FlaG n=1 Tax=Thermodesulfovibrio sp. TaxID=2067987 RepID=UPI0030AE5EBE
MRLDGIDREIIPINPYRGSNNVQHIELPKLNEEIQLKNLTQPDETTKQLQKPVVSQEELNKIMEELRHKFNMLERYLKIDIDSELKMPISKIIDMRTEEVIRQIPPEWIVDILRRMNELKGIFYAEEV